MPSGQSWLPIAVLAAVFLLTAVRQVRWIRLEIWQIMTGGALAVLLSGSIGPMQAIESINPDVMIFLFGMFTLGEALIESGYLYTASHGIFKGARSVDSLVLRVLFATAFLSAFLMNDTIAIVGTPLMLSFAARHNISSKLLLLTLCFAVTLGSVASPIGNPQNLLVALGGAVPAPFLTFIRYLAVPTVLNLFIAYLILKALYSKEFHSTELEHSRPAVRDSALATLSRSSLYFVFAAVALKAGLVLFGAGLDFRLTYVAAAGAAPVLLFSPKRWKILKNIDWRTLVFFAALFILVRSVWECGALQAVLARLDGRLDSTGFVIASSVLASQLLSNVPFVAVFLPVLTQSGAGVRALMALAAGATVAGNLFILGAASNVIVIQGAEKRGASLGFLEFARAGVPLTLVNALVYWAYLIVFG